MNNEEEVKLTQFSAGAGCGCKIAPTALQEILQTSFIAPDDKNLLVGNGKNDDAAVYALEDENALISSSDFFTPIVDDAFDFGRIAAANALSDIYAMGGKPLMAIALLGWPLEKLGAALAAKVLDGARTICKEAGISLAGGHSIDIKEPMFGLAVSGMVKQNKLLKNSTAKEGDHIFITKPIGVGILSTAQKRGFLEKEDEAVMIKQMTTLNSFGATLGNYGWVTAMTDVTGFGILGHLIEMAEGANLSANLYYSKVPILPAAKKYLAQKLIPDATYRNWNAYSKQTSFAKTVNVMEAFTLLPDPQTNGGLLFTVAVENLANIQQLLKDNSLEAFIEPIGVMTERKEKVVEVIL